VSPPPLVLLHGLGTGPSGWQPQVDAFSPSRTVVTPALRLDTGFDFGTEARRVLADLAPGSKIDLCGLSLGALVALRAAVDEPQRIRRLALAAGFASLPRRMFYADSSSRESRRRTARRRGWRRRSSTDGRSGTSSTQAAASTSGRGSSG
jgi:pimeloyl-ACP methyl ester carboxylesterase